MRQTTPNDRAAPPPLPGLVPAANPQRESARGAGLPAAARGAGNAGRAGQAAHGEDRGGVEGECSWSPVAGAAGCLGASSQLEPPSVVSCL